MASTVSWQYSGLLGEPSWEELTGGSTVLRCICQHRLAALPRTIVAPGGRGPFFALPVPGFAAGQLPKLLAGMLPPPGDTETGPASEGWPSGQRFVQAPHTLTGGPGLHKVTVPGVTALGSSDNSGVSEADAMQWNAHDWKFDPYAMRAIPVLQDGKALGNKQQISSGGVEPPTSAGAQASQQPAKLPALAMPLPTTSRSKSHPPTCQVPNQALSRSNVGLISVVDLLPQLATHFPCDYCRRLCTNRCWSVQRLTCWCDAAGGDLRD